jgi:anti-sigma regulatory factor (Ser/Thr protein kinase)
MTPTETVQAERYRYELPAFPQIIAGIRKVVGAYVCLWGWEQVAEDAELCVAELLSNVRKHAGSPRCVLTLERLAGGVRVTVSDLSRALPVVREPDWTAEGGRGLALVTSAAGAWGTAPTDTGKDVWFEVGPRAGERPAVCGERAKLPDALAREALTLGAGAEPADVECEVRCALESHPVGDHMAFVRELGRTGAVWTRWSRGNPPYELLALPDCTATGPDHEPCGEYAGHPGAHTWQLTDDWRPDASRP